MSSIEEHGTLEPDSDRSGFIRVLAATAIVGVAGYVITWLVPRVIGAEAYATFAVFWSFAFLLAAGLSGIQQEITRATLPVRGSAAGSATGSARTPATEAGHRPRLSPIARFGLVAAGLVTAAVLVTAIAWGPAIFPAHVWSLVIPLAVAAGSYVLLAVLTGTLYGIAHWTALFWAILVEGVLRLALIAGTLAVTVDDIALAWAVAIPFPATFLIVWLAYRRRLAGRTRLDVGYRALTWNVARTIVASISMGMLVSGFPLLLDVTTPDSGGVEFAILLLLIVLVRAPLIVVGMALQSYFVVVFRNAGERFWKTLAVLLGGVAVAGVLLGAAGWLWGPGVFGFLFPDEPVPDAALVAALAGSSAVLGALCISAPAALARAHHGLFTIGWSVAALVTIGMLLLPLDAASKTIIALVVGPATGLAVHLIGLGMLRTAAPLPAGSPTTR